MRGIKASKEGKNNTERIQKEARMDTVEED